MTHGARAGGKALHEETLVLLHKAFEEPVLCRDAVERLDVEEAKALDVNRTAVLEKGQHNASKSACPICTLSIL